MKTGKSTSLTSRPLLLCSPVSRIYVRFPDFTFSGFLRLVRRGIQTQRHGGHRELFRSFSVSSVPLFFSFVPFSVNWTQLNTVPTWKEFLLNQVPLCRTQQPHHGQPLRPEFPESSRRSSLVHRPSKAIFSTTTGSPSRAFRRHLKAG